MACPHIVIRLLFAPLPTTSHFCNLLYPYAVSQPIMFSCHFANDFKQKKGHEKKSIKDIVLGKAVCIHKRFIWNRADHNLEVI